MFGIGTAERRRNVTQRVALSIDYVTRRNARVTVPNEQAAGAEAQQVQELVEAPS